MPKRRDVFDQGWLTRTHEAPRASWVSRLLSAPEADRQTYLSTLRECLDDFPRPSSEKRHLAAQLESFDTLAHQGAVNELVWWGVMQQLGWPVEPVPTRKNEARPDFIVTAEPRFFVEVTTLNPPALRNSAEDAVPESRAVAAGVTVRSPLDVDRSNLAHRLIGKLASEEKARQTAFAERNGTPLLAVVFDYTIWSGFGVDDVPPLAYALRDQGGFARMPPTVAAILLVNGFVEDGAPQVRLPFSGLIRNPGSRFGELPPALFPPFRIF